MSNQDGLRASTACSIFKGCNPFLAVGVVPVALLNADKGRIGCLPEGLPMLRTGVADAWKNQGRRKHNWLHDERANV